MARIADNHFHIIQMTLYAAEARVSIIIAICTINFDIVIFRGKYNSFSTCCFYEMILLYRNNTSSGIGISKLDEISSHRLTETTKCLNLAKLSHKAYTTVTAVHDATTLTMYSKVWNCKSKRKLLSHESLSEAAILRNHGKERQGKIRQRRSFSFHLSVVM